MQPRSQAAAARRAFWEVACVAFTADEVRARKFASATSEACFVAFWTVSIALLAAAMADFIRAAADSVPAGAFLTAPSTTSTKFDCALANWASAILLTSAFVAAAMS